MNKQPGGIGFLYFFMEPCELVVFEDSLGCIFSIMLMG